MILVSGCHGTGLDSANKPDRIMTPLLICAETYRCHRRALLGAVGDAIKAHSKDGTARAQDRSGLRDDLAARRRIPHTSHEDGHEPATPQHVGRKEERQDVVIGESKGHDQYVDEHDDAARPTEGLTAQDGGGNRRGNAVLQAVDGGLAHHKRQHEREHFDGRVDLGVGRLRSICLEDLP